jgi:hypothetical protein
MDFKKLLVISIAVMSVIGFSMAVIGTNTAVKNTAGSANLGTVNSQITSSGNQNSTAISQFHSFENKLNSTASSKVKGSNLSAKGITTPSFLNNLSSSLKNNLFLPNYKAAQDYKIVDGHVKPSYVSAPAPMGIGDFGLKNVSGVLTPYQLSTNSFEGTISISNLTALYALNDDPSNITVQLNTVLNNVTLFGNSTYSFWTQNVLLYSSEHHTIQFEDNLWNFSNNKTFLTSNAIYNSTGKVLPYTGVHIAYGPSFAVKTPFTVHLYLNSTLIDNRNAVYFNYSVPQLSVHGTYDLVIFNSTYHVASTFKTRQANFLISGTHVTPTGFLLYDAEIMIGGPGGGSTTTLYNVNANMTLKYYNVTNSAYMNVPSVYDYGTDTGETSSGESIYWNSNDVAEINTGPSILQGMWGIQSAAKVGDMKITGQIAPSNAFIFVNSGTMVNNLTAQWSPTQTNGKFMLFLTPGTYSIQVLLSNYAPMYMQNISGSSGSNSKIGTLSLMYNNTYGGYTPLYAFNNEQLANISVTGQGLANDSYILASQEFVDPVFGQVNDFGFPVFMAVFLSRTTMYATSLDTNQAVTELSYNTTFIGCDTMPYAIYKAQNYSMIGMDISGYFFPGVDGFIAGEVTFWDSSNDVVFGTSFESRYPVTTVNSTDITISNSIIDYEGGDIYLYCGSVNLARDQIEYSTLIEVNGTANLIGSTISETCLIGEDGASMAFRGNIMLDNCIVSLNTNVINTDNIGEENCYYYSSSSISSMNNNLEENLVVSQDSSINIFGGQYIDITVRAVNSSISFTGSYLNSTCIEAINSMVVLNSVKVFETEITSMDGINNIESITGSEFFILSVESNTMISNSHIFVLEGLSELGNFKVSSSMIEGAEFESIFSNNTFTNNVIQSIPTTTYLGYDYPTFIFTYDGNNVLSGDTFAVINFQNNEEVFCEVNQVNFNSVTLLDGVNSVTGSTFYTSGGDSAANLIVQYGTNNIQGNTFESRHVNLLGNEYGAGSSLIVYGGVNVIGHNKFISINSPASSSLIKYGDVSTQTSNQYLYSINFTETGLPNGTAWSVDVNGTTHTTTGSYINLLVSPGTYSFKATSYGYGSLSGSVDVVSSSVNEPLAFSKLPQYSVTFMNSGLPSGVNWTVTMDHMTMSGYTNMLTFTNIPMGTYTYTVADSSSHYSPIVASGTIDVTSNMTQSVLFKGVTYTVTFKENGLSSGKNWTVTVNGRVYSSTNSSITLTMPIGSNLTYRVGNESGYISSVRTGNFAVYGNYSVTVNYAKPGVSPTLTDVGIAVAAIAGLAVGAGVMLVLRKKTVP